jgi:AcrR family transcriptional regulator
MGKLVVDRRVQRTRLLLQEALVALILEKGYETVTVQDLIDRANVGRSTFYTHFRDKEELFLSGFESLWSQFEKHLVNQAVPDASPWIISLILFQHAQSYHRVYKALVGKQAGHVMLSHIHKVLTVLTREHLKVRLSNNTSELVPPDILAHYLVSSFLALLTWWLDNNLPYSAERMNEMYRHLTQPGMDAILRLTSAQTR